MRRPDIIWIFADELRASALNCYGGAWTRVWTPNMDRLAAQGVRFSRAYCNSPVCVPSRLSILTGQPPERTGVYFNEGAWSSFPLPVRLDTFPEHFARHGYRVASFGKSHHNKAYTPWPEENVEGASMHGFGLDTDAARLDPIVPAGIPSPVGGAFPADRPYPPEVITRNALSWLDQQHDRPFLLRVSYLQPHTPVLPPAHYRHLYPAADWPGHALERGGGSLYERRFAEIVGGPDLSHAQMQQAQADYHALVTWLDAQIGLLLGWVEARGRQRDTIIVLTSDHGASLGENGLLSKVVFAPQSHRVPLIVSWPGSLPEGEHRDDLVQSLDLARTLITLASLPENEGFAGRALFADRAPDAIFATVGTGAPGAKASASAATGTWPDGRGWPRRACIRTARYRLDMNVRQDGAPVPLEDADLFLADSEANPGETINRVGDPALAGMRETLIAALLAHAADGIEPDSIPKSSALEAPEFQPPTIGPR